MLDDLAPRLDEHDLPWAPVRSIEELVDDEQARANGFIRSRALRSGREIDTIAPPFQLRDVDLSFGSAPAPGQHREELLLELGYSWEEIERLAEAGAF